MSDWAPDPGDIIWLDFSPTVGTEQSGRRPAFVISDLGYNEASGRALLAPITSRVRGWPFEVALPAGSAVEGVVIVDQASYRRLARAAREVRRRRAGRHLGRGPREAGGAGRLPVTIPSLEPWGR